MEDKYENETSFTLIIKENSSEIEAQRFKQAASTCDPNNRRIILYFTNGNRLSECGRYEKKITTFSRNKFIIGSDSRFFPVRQTRSVESLEDKFSFNSTRISGIVDRIILDERELKFNDAYTLSLFDKQKIIFRACLQKETQITSNNLVGIRFTIRFEIEYCADIDEKALDVLERCVFIELINTTLQHFKLNVILQPMLIEELHQCVAEKLHIWDLDFENTAKKLNAKWAVKYDGIKCKCLFKKISNKSAEFFVWPDCHNSVRCYFFTENENILNMLENSCVQCEIMNDCIVLVSILAIKFDDNIFHNTPNNNLNCLSNLCKLSLDNKIIGYASDSTSVQFGVSVNACQLLLPIQTSGTILKKSHESFAIPIFVQYFVDDPNQLEFDSTKHDGLVAVIDNTYLKFKRPTFDARRIKPNVYETGDDENKIGIVFDETNLLDKSVQNLFENPEYQNAIYEFAFDESDNQKSFKIIRRRCDRHACSTSKEFFDAYNTYRISLNVKNNLT